MDNITIRRFDLVKLKTTLNVNYLSADIHEAADPRGVWSVIAILGKELLLCQKKAVIKIPASDVLLHHNYDLQNVLESIEKKK